MQRQNGAEGMVDAGLLSNAVFGGGGRKSVNAKPGRHLIEEHVAGIAQGRDHALGTVSSVTPAPEPSVAKFIVARTPDGGACADDIVLEPRRSGDQLEGRSRRVSA